MRTEEPKQLQNDLWHSADKLRANSDLKSTEYSTPVLRIIFLKLATTATGGSIRSGLSRDELP